MRAIVYDRFGGPEVLHLAEVEEPTPGAGQVQIRVRTAGVNPVDAKQRRGDFAAAVPARFPQRLGNEYAGVVAALGAGVTGLAVGAEVFGSATGQCYAEAVVVDATEVVAKPPEMPWQIAGTLSAVGQTAYTALNALDVQPGDTLLVHAAAGGVGSIAVQLARQRGAAVIGTASAGHHDYLRSLGVTPVSYGPGLAERIALLAPDGIDAALDLVGGDAISTSLALVNDRDRIGTTVDAEAVRSYGIQRLGARSTAALLELATLCSHGLLTLSIEAAYPLAEAERAHEHIETGHVKGKIALLVG
ncbi:MAG: enoyl reductase [Frankiales bacterium]|nr:enoyl reductase [Frankiales bacterium]